MVILPEVNSACELDTFPNRLQILNIKPIERFNIIVHKYQVSFKFKKKMYNGFLFDFGILISLRNGDGYLPQK